MSVVKFTRFEDRTVEESQHIMRCFEDARGETAGRVLDELRRLRNITNGFLISVYDHSLQTATRAHRDGASEDMVVVALLHDIGESLCPTNHAAFAADVVGPYVSEDLEWMLRHHTLFQGYYFFHHYGLDRHGRDRFRDHPMYQQTVDFCANWDQASFDPAYDTLPLEFFEPMVRRVFNRKSRGFI